MFDVSCATVISMHGVILCIVTPVVKKLGEPLRGLFSPTAIVFITCLKSALSFRKFWCAVGAIWFVPSRLLVSPVRFGKRKWRGSGKVVVHHGVVRPLVARHPFVLVLLVINVPSLISTVVMCRWDASQYLGTCNFVGSHLLVHWVQVSILVHADDHTTTPTAIFCFTTSARANRSRAFSHGIVTGICAMCRGFCIAKARRKIRNLADDKAVFSLRWDRYSRFRWYDNGRGSSYVGVFSFVLPLVVGLDVLIRVVVQQLKL